MRSYLDAKSIARTLRAELAARQHDVTHAESLEMVAKLFGFRDWNGLAARIGEAPPPKDGKTLTLPHGWIRGGSAANYDMGVATKGVAEIRSRFGPDRQALQETFGTLMQSILADTHLGRKLRLSAEIRTEDARGAATLWLRIDGEGKRTLRFDNMEERTSGGVLTGTTSWQRREIVLDVPEDAQTINFGFYLRGSGRAQARSFNLAPAGDEAEVTALGAPTSSEPVNLAFD